MLPVRSDFDFTPPALREVSLRVAAVNGINLGQGVCQTPTPSLLMAAASRAVAAGYNRYAPAQGVEELRAAITAKLASFNRLEVAPESLLVTSGSTGGFESIVQTVLEAGDEVILFRPYYPYHYSAVLRARGSVRFVDMTPPHWDFSFEQLESLITSRTKMMVVCNPNNPTGRIFTKDELLRIGELCAARTIWCVTDEVYEYLTFDGAQHVSLAALPGMQRNTILIGSYSKTFSITGWRIGYLLAPQEIAAEIRAVSDQLYVCAPTPLQHAVAAGIRELPPQYYDTLRADYQHKRALMEQALQAGGFKVYRPAGAYYFLVDTRDAFPGMCAETVLDRLIDVSGIGAVPTRDFMGPNVRGKAGEDCYLRFCFSVPDEVLREAHARLARFRAEI